MRNCGGVTVLSVEEQRFGASTGAAVVGEKRSFFMLKSDGSEGRQMCLSTSSWVLILRACKCMLSLKCANTWMLT